MKCEQSMKIRIVCVGATRQYHNPAPLACDIRSNGAAKGQPEPRTAFPPPENITGGELGPGRRPQGSADADVAGTASLDRRAPGRVGGQKFTLLLFSRGVTQRVRRASPTLFPNHNKVRRRPEASRPLASCAPSRAPPTRGYRSTSTKENSCQVL